MTIVVLLFQMGATFQRRTQITLCGYLQLTGVSLSDTKLDNLGRILTGKITIKLTEYAEEASSKKASSGKSSSSGKSGSSSKSAAGIATYKELGISSSAVNVGASSSAKASKKPTNAQLK
jgi:hypothetical protein